MTPIERVKRLLAAADMYDSVVSEHYDDVVRQAAANACAFGALGKFDIGALVAWKRLRANTPYMSRLMAMPDSDVRSHTARAMEAARDEGVSVDHAAKSARSALSPLPGFARGDALASAIRYALAPDRMAVYDRRSHAGLRLLGLELPDRPGRYGVYMALIEGLRVDLRAAGHSWSARRVDMALYHLGGDESLVDLTGLVAGT